MNTPPTRREPGIAVLLSFVWAGLGNMYNGRNVGRGIFFAVGELIGLFLFIVPGLIIWIWGMFDAYSEANTINQEFDAQEEEKTKQVTESQQKTAGSRDFVARIKKLAKLRAAEMLDEQEFASRKRELIIELADSSLDGNSEDFLAELIPLRQSESITDEELKQIKQFIL